MRLRRAAMSTMLGALTVGALAVPAAAEPPTADLALRPQTPAVAEAPSGAERAETAQGRWIFIREYFWGGDCVNAGQEGVATGKWEKFECRDGSWRTNYKLWAYI